MCCVRLAGNAGPKNSPKIRHVGTIAQLCLAISSQIRHVSTIGRKLLNNNNFPTCPYNMVNFGPLAAEICWRVWGTPTNFNGFRVLAALLQGTLVVGVSQTLRRWTDGATYIRRAAITLGIGPYSSLSSLTDVLSSKSVVRWLLGIWQILSLSLRWMYFENRRSYEQKSCMYRALLSCMPGHCAVER